MRVIALVIGAVFAAATAASGQDPLADVIEETCATVESTLCPCPECAVCPTCRYPATGQSQSHFEGEDGNPAFGSPLAYRDNGDGTIMDLNTGLIWEKKVAADGLQDPDNLHDADNVYTWLGECVSELPLPPRPDPQGEPGTALETVEQNFLTEWCGTDADCPDDHTCETWSGRTIFHWVAELNARSFAGYDDWRVPNVKELLSIVDYGRSSPAIDPAFHGSSCGAACTDLTDSACSCTRSDSESYWSATRRGESRSSSGWAVNFIIGESVVFGGSVRAVRSAPP